MTPATDAPTEPPSSGTADVVRAYQLVRDLFVPSARLYWAELVVTASAAWAAILVAACAEVKVVAVFAAVVAVPLWYRAAMMIHELAHQRRDKLPGFHLAWNFVIGVAWLLPSIMYEGVHNGHHKKTTYGTANDPEYLRFAGGLWTVLGFIGFSFVVFPGLLLRFLVAAPLSWAFPPVRRWLIRSASSYAINLGHVRRMSRAERRSLVASECVILLVWWPLLALTIASEVSWQWLVVWYSVHTATVLVNRVRMLTAHRFGSDGNALNHLGQFADSIDTPGGWWTELWAPLGTRYHALHHLFPTLPFHNMRTAYRRLVAHLPEGSFYHETTGRSLIPSLLQVVTGSARPPLTNTSQRE